ncbi:HNH endonuclease [Mycobacterium phage Kumao]|uniref:HNH endonuclease n=1 Tax=Mycobacterium phage Kumao TaxID=2041344 RepID=A0A2D1GPS6_9CAUD|nr:HNH endonuclease [Mycobacterium phage Kumao]ATN94049.1 HNH endonuclease [Mycobacterium phage Kumao]
MRNRGHRNTNERGGSKQRRARKQWLLDTFGDGTQAPCSDCGELVDFHTIFVDRIIPAHLGGTYRRDNIRPHCRTCSCRQGQRMRLELKKELCLA